ncbi:MAG: hypothetical protein NPIRA03_00240 [Nitrospirales bacterium]|nr:MAG: hypothetical protein NPIRA03_00240 [Nitrospirales bacterium]
MLANKTGEELANMHSMVNAMVGMIQQNSNATEEQSVATRQIAGDLEFMTQNNSSDNKWSISNGQSLSRFGTIGWGSSEVSRIN